MDVVIVDAVRTPFAPSQGALRGWHPVELAAETLKALTDRCKLEPGQVGHLYLGCATTIGEQSQNIARNAALAAGWPEVIAATSVEGGIAVGQLALHSAVARVVSGLADVCVAGGVESSSRVPTGASITIGVGKPFGPAVHERFAGKGGLVPPGVVAENLVKRYEIERSALDTYLGETLEKARKTEQSSGQKAETVAVDLRSDTGRSAGEMLQQDVLMPVLDTATCKPIFEPNGVITAANFARSADGAAALVVASSKWCKANKVQPLARITSVASRGTAILDGDSGYTTLQQLALLAKFELDQLTRVELFEDSAATPLALMRDSGLSRDAINPLGGALAHGSALGASGTRVVVSLAHGLVADGEQRGVALVAGSSTVATATMVEV